MNQTDSGADGGEPSVSRMSIAYLLCVTAGIGIAIAIARAIEQVRFSADSWYYLKEATTELDSFAMLVASVYGFCVTTFVFAVRSGQVWKSPGKILSLLFASMCLLNWGLDVVAGAIVSYRIDQGPPVDVQVPKGITDVRGYIWGIWYRNFAAAIGYIVVLPLLVFVMLKSRKQPFHWQLVWAGFLVFDLLIVAQVHFQASSYVTSFWRAWYFDLAIGLPLTLLGFALFYTFARRRHVDWWTAVVSLPLLLVWCAGIGLKLYRM